MSDNYFYTPGDEPRPSRRSAKMPQSPNRLTEIAMRLEGFFRDPKIGALVLLSIMAGALTGLVLAYQANFTSFAAEVDDALTEYRPPTITKVFADDGKTVIGELALERRIPIEYKDIPETL